MKITFARAALALLAGCAPLQPGDPGYTYWNDPTFRSGEARDRIDQEYIARFQAKCKRVGEVARASGVDGGYGGDLGVGIAVEGRAEAFG